MTESRILTSVEFMAGYDPEIHAAAESAYRRGYTQGASAAVRAMLAVFGSRVPKTIGLFQNWADGSLLQWRASVGHANDTHLPPTFDVKGALTVANQEHSMDIAFTLEYFEFVRREQTAGRFAVDRFVVGDGQPEKEPGLRASISDVGIFFHVKYEVNGKPCFFQLGRFPETSIEDARAMAKAALDMARGGVDPVEEMQIRLRRELLARGAGGGRA